MSPPEGSQDTLACPPMTGCSLLSGVAPCQDSGGERESEVHASELLSPPFPIKHEFTEHLLHARLGRAATGSMEGLLCWGADHPPHASWRALHLLQGAGEQCRWGLE